MNTEQNFVQLYTSSGWLKGYINITSAGIVWSDVDEAAKNSEASKDSTCFTVFTISKKSSSSNHLKNTKRPICDSWSFNAKDNKTALYYIHQIQELIRPGYNAKSHNVLVMINPFSGRKKSIKIFKNFVEPVFKLSNVSYKIFETKHSMHAFEFMQKEDLSTFTAFCSVSGDGLLHEMANGFLSRPDWKRYKNIPFGIIPAGSGNGLAWSVDCGWPELASVAIAKNCVESLDIMAVSKPAELTCFCFLSLTYGYIADVDVESEIFRALGSIRTDIYGTFLLLNLRQYKAKIHYLPADFDKNITSSKPQTLPTDSDKIDNSINLTKKIDLNKQDFGSSSPIEIQSQNNIVHKPSPLKNTSSPNDSAYNSFENSLNNHDNTPKLSSMYTQIVPKLNSYEIDLPITSNNLPPGWKTAEGPFTFVNIVNVPWLSKSHLSSEEAHIGDGMLDLIWTNSKSRTKLLPYLTSSTTGGHLNKNDIILHRKVSSIIIEPELQASKLETEECDNNESNRISNSKTKNTKPNKKKSLANNQKNGIFSFDGEPSPVSSVKIDVIPKLLNVITSPWFENINYKNKHSSAPKTDSRAAIFGRAYLSKSNSTVSFF
ncbi:hypothetical protein BB561_004058 [Smittium simulii]|uniref:DAGKc domain-containing protein n=1 Tax=Smittium simulii TaxID=133385 RepID=A0A2T9YI95_9FUNG|nr:hypothetical protein BB561_004058 [Smittium simulii]